MASGDVQQTGCRYAAVGGGGPGRHCGVHVPRTAAPTLLRSTRRLQQHLLRIVPDVDVAVVERSQDPAGSGGAGTGGCRQRRDAHRDGGRGSTPTHAEPTAAQHPPWLCGVQLHALHAVRPLREHLLRAGKGGEAGRWAQAGTSGRAGAGSPAALPAPPPRRPASPRARPVAPSDRSTDDRTLISRRSGCSEGTEG